MMMMMMRRQPVHRLRVPSQMLNGSIQPGAWRRLFTSQSREQLPAQLWRKSASFQSLLTRLRVGHALPSYATTPVTFRGAARWFRFSVRRSQTAGAGSKSQEPQSLSARLRKLTKEYGWAALGVYLGLSVLDFPFCFLLVRIVGTDRIGKIEHYVVSAIKQVIPEPVQEWWHENWRSVKQAEVRAHGDDDISDRVEMAGWGVQEAQERNKKEASLGTQLALAYAIHKTFIFIRVPLTAAFTPKVVKVLRSWGWNIGKKRGPRA